MKYRLTTWSELKTNYWVMAPGYIIGAFVLIFTVGAMIAVLMSFAGLNPRPIAFYIGIPGWILLGFWWAFKSFFMKLTEAELHEKKLRKEGLNWPTK